MKIAFYSPKERNREKAGLRKREAQLNDKRSHKAQVVNTLFPGARKAVLLIPERSTRLA